ncbi:hypothetical protein ACIA8G_14450 [Lentzea sp. NPDC051213]|uniref:hypothetical protein n=1 Tax=Lentzea sp. NPDC051213 TaxID=3364126 RepID=UPI0037A34FCB
MRSAAVLLVSALLLAASAGPGRLPDHERRQIEELARSYFQHRADKLTNSPQVSGFGVPTTEAFAAQLRIDESKLHARRERHNSYSPGGYYSHAKARITLRRVVVDPDGSVITHIREETALHYREFGGVTHSSFAMTHVLIFNRTAHGWVLAAAMQPPGAVCKLPPNTQFCGRLSEP